MTMITGNDLVGKALASQGADTIFFIMGGPMNDALNASAAAGLRLIDVRHEQAGAMMAHAFARVRNRPGVCAGASGPGTINLVTGLANALIDCAPVVALGGATPIRQWGTGAFQEIDQLAIMRPVTKWAERVHDAARIPELIDRAFHIATSGKPGPVYLDLPGDVLYSEIEAKTVRWPVAPDLRPRPRPKAAPDEVEAIVDALGKASRPILLTGSGIIWSDAHAELQAFTEKAGIPFYTTPQGRGVIPEDHALCYPLARSTAFKETDLVLVVGTRLNYVFSHVRPPRFPADAPVIRVDIDPAEIAGSENVDIGVVGDAKAVLAQLTDAIPGVGYGAWRSRLAQRNAEKVEGHEAKLADPAMPIHPLRLCRELRDVIGRDAILCVDGQEILNYGRMSIPSYRPGHRLNSGPFGTMGVGLPFGVGAKAARPDAEVVVLHGDGSFGLNAMELDTAVRHKLPLLVVISLNGGWTADPEKVKPGRDLGYTRFDKMAEALGCYSDYVDDPNEIRPALERALERVRAGQVAVVNVVTDWKARSVTTSFTAFST
ncbi:thiamine pyrophosphate-binding protein [Silicimonas algicola]|uniref:Acetolactate synthase-1/2/3 large subunit n=1 Tax=Silicimonas algicola TaxID=1826607 RepID=A0A316FYU5_9RHOB|nr:thiamine pyrophosphate-binding protein [Silicimonas algicola]AZQ68306.1 thiamine pyrophosphate-binding protein [Silicimonas algicola]PWK52720.1 acetolactate synthase-1/2/3 large subunit [Silicimonas algicola]